MAGTDAIRIAESDVPAGGALVLPDSGVALVRDGSEVLVIDLGCTHLGCTVSAVETGFACPCHGSQFNRSGQVLSGPAVHPLRHLPIEKEAGFLRVAPASGSPCISRLGKEAGKV